MQFFGVYRPFLQRSLGSVAEVPAKAADKLLMRGGTKTINWVLMKPIHSENEYIQKTETLHFLACRTRLNSALQWSKNCTYFTLYAKFVARAIFKVLWVKYIDLKCLTNIKKLRLVVCLWLVDYLTFSFAIVMPINLLEGKRRCNINLERIL